MRVSDLDGPHEDVVPTRTGDAHGSQRLQRQPPGHQPGGRLSVELDQQGQTRAVRGSVEAPNLLVVARASAASPRASAADEARKCDQSAAVSRDRIWGIVAVAAR